MSVDKSLKLSKDMQRHRNVLSRAERIASLRDSEKWEDGRSIFGLPKVRTIKAKRRAKVAEKPDEAAVALEGETTEEAAAADNAS